MHQVTSSVPDTVSELRPYQIVELTQLFIDLAGHKQALDQGMATIKQALEKRGVSLEDELERIAELQRHQSNGGVKTLDWARLV